MNSFKKFSLLASSLFFGWQVLLTSSMSPFSLGVEPSKSFFLSVAVFTSFNVIFQLVGAIFAKKLDRFLLNPKFATLACLFMSVGSITVYARVFSASDGNVFLIAGACLAAAGGAFYFGTWIKSISILCNNDIMKQVSLTLLLAIGANLALVGLPSNIAIFASFVVPLVLILATLCVIEAGKLMGNGNFREEDSERLEVHKVRNTAIDLQSNKEWFRDVFLLALGAFCYGLSTQYIRAAGWGTETAEIVSNYLVFHLLGVAVSAIMLYLFATLALLRQRSVLNDGIGAYAAIVLIVGILVPLCTFSSASDIANAVVGVGIGLIEINLLFYAAAITGRARRPALFSIGVFWGIMALASLVGQFLRAFVDVYDFGGSQSYILVTVVVVAVLLAVCLFLMNPSLRRLFISLEEATMPSAASAFRETSRNEDAYSRDEQESHGAEMSVRRNSLEQTLLGKGLTPRETEVALLLFEGRSLPFIEGELNISHGTANTHLRHIYGKLNVHNRQEFLSVLAELL